MSKLFICMKMHWLVYIDLILVNCRFCTQTQQHVSLSSGCFHHAFILSEVSIMMDPTYNKGYYRKLRSLLELKSF